VVPRGASVSALVPSKFARPRKEYSSSLTASATGAADSEGRKREQPSAPAIYGPRVPRQEELHREEGQGAQSFPADSRDRVQREGEPDVAGHLREAEAAARAVHEQALLGEPEQDREGAGHEEEGAAAEGAGRVFARGNGKRRKLTPGLQNQAGGRHFEPEGLPELAGAQGLLQHAVHPPLEDAGM
jgi:hypothetical protein